jgi:hypothetical protein
MLSTSFARAIGKVTDPAIHFALHRVQAEFEIRDDAEISAAATHAPEQIRILLGAGMAKLSVRP